MNTIQDLGSPNAEAQALLADMPLKEARIWARNSFDHYASLRSATPAITRLMRFWSDVSTLLRLETQSDEQAA